jgi:glycosyltransferase involved in cell wall biosynthesis
MRVGIELRSAVRGSSGGIVSVISGTLCELFQRRPDMQFVVFCTPFNRSLLSTDAANVEFVTLPLDGFFVALDSAARERRIEVLFRSFPTVEELEYPLDRQIFLIPDVIHEYHPEFLDPETLAQRRRAFALAYGAGAIAAISEHGRATIARHAARGRLIFVMSPGVPTEFAEARSADMTEAERDLVPQGDFFLFPANLWPSKNHDRLLEAFRLVCERSDTPVELVLTGALTGWDELLGRHPVLPVEHVGFVSEALLRGLFEQATALAFFTLWEGFGIPVLEAFSVGTAVVCGNRGSLPEVAGDAALICDPTDVEAMSRSMRAVMSDHALRHRLIARGAERAQLYTWSKAADRLAAAIEQVNATRRFPFAPRALIRTWRAHRTDTGPAVVATPAPPVPPEGRPRVTGYWSDNWLDPTLEVVLRRGAGTHPLRIEGIPVTDMTATLSVAGRSPRSVELHGGSYETVELEPGAPGDLVSIRFSERVEEGGRRVVSFLLQSTNLFTEEDLTARTELTDGSVEEHVLEE